MNAFEIYKKYIALNLHFSGNYDYFKYGGSVNAKRETFETRNDKYFFERLRKKYKEDEIELFFVANLLYTDQKIWVGRLLDEQCHQVYLKLLNKTQKLSYFFGEELDKIVDYLDTEKLTFDDLFPVKNNQHPLLLRLYSTKKISIETLLIMNEVLGFFPMWDKHIEETYIWPNTRTRCLKYLPFIKPSIDVKKFKQIMKEKVL